MKIPVTLLGLILGFAAQGASIQVYFGTGGNGAKGIYHSEFDAESGRLGPAELAAAIGSPGFLALHPDDSVLYAVARDEGEPCVAAYRIGTGGSLHLLNTEAIGDGEGAHLGVHSSGKFLMTAQYGGGSTAVFPLTDEGRLEERGQLFEHEGGSGVVAGRQEKPHPHWCGFSPDGRFAFVPDLGMDKIVIYRVDLEKPGLERHGYATALPGAGPRHMRFSADGRFIYLLNELAVSVTTFDYDGVSGVARRLTTTPALSEATKAEETSVSASEILVHPNGRFVYSGNRGDDSVTVYEADPETGILAVREVESIRGAWPRNINLDPTGRWLLAAGAHSNTVSVFAIDPKTGELTFRRGGVINVPDPICIVFHVPAAEAP